MTLGVIYENNEVSVELLKSGATKTPPAFPSRATGGKSILCHISLSCDVLFIKLAHTSSFLKASLLHFFNN